MKAGVMEIADVYLLNKADTPGIEKLEQELGAMLSLGHRRDGWMPPLVRCVAHGRTGHVRGCGSLQAFPRVGDWTPARRAKLGIRLREMYRDRVYSHLPGEVVEAAAASASPHARLTRIRHCKSGSTARQTGARFIDQTANRNHRRQRPLFMPGFEAEQERVSKRHGACRRKRMSSARSQARRSRFSRATDAVTASRRRN